MGGLLPIHTSSLNYHILGDRMIVLQSTFILNVNITFLTVPNVNPADKISSYLFTIDSGDAIISRPNSHASKTHT
jgi:hypothetical protein